MGPLRRVTPLFYFEVTRDFVRERYLLGDRPRSKQRPKRVTQSGPVGCHPDIHVISIPQRDVDSLSSFVFSCVFYDLGADWRRHGEYVPGLAEVNDGTGKAMGIKLLQALLISLRES